MSTLPDHIIFFDGVCNLCNSSVNFIIRHDKHEIFHFASLQWKISRKILGKEYPENEHYESVIYYEKGKVFQRSEAALRIAKKLDPPYSFLSSLRIIPSFLRDPVYMYISKNRYKWFGKKDSCMLPSPSLRNRFLNSSM